MSGAPEEAEQSERTGPLARSLLDRLRPQRIVVLRTGRLGDVLVATPALRALRAAAPQARITLLIDEVARPMAERISSIDEAVVVPPMPNLHWEGQPFAAPDQVERFFEAMRRQRFDLAIQLKGEGYITNPFVQRLGARVTAGQRASDAPPLDLDMPYAPVQPEVLRLLDVMRLLGAPALGSRLQLAPRPEDFDEARGLPGLDWSRLRHGRVAGVNIGARSGARRWPLGRFQCVIDWLLAETELDVAILGGPADRQRAAELMAMLQMRPRVVDLAGRTTVGGLVGIVDRLRLLITNDSFPAHLAAALDTPAVIIFGNGHPARWAPLSRVTQRPLIDCFAPCRVPGRACGCPDGEGEALCLTNISTHDVIEQARALLELEGQVARIAGPQPGAELADPLPTSGAEPREAAVD